MRYAHQVSLAALIKLAEEAFEEQDEFNNFDVWRESKTKENANIRFWFHAIELETAFFLHKKSSRCRFPSFCPVHQRYHAMDVCARPHSLCSMDVQMIPTKHPSILEEFMKGRFTIKNGNRAFSNIGVDQAHEQNNKLVKIEGGAIGIFDNPKALLRWAVA